MISVPVHCMPAQQYNLIVTENKMSLDAALERDIARVIAETPKGSGRWLASALS